MEAKLLDLGANGELEADPGGSSTGLRIGLGRVFKIGLDTSIEASSVTVDMLGCLEALLEETFSCCC